MMLVPHIAGGSPVTSVIMAQSRRASSRCCSLGTRARNSSTGAPVWRIAGPLLAAIPSCSHTRAGLPGHGAAVARRGLVTFDQMGAAVGQLIWIGPEVGDP